MGHRKKWTKEEKLKILSYFEENGIAKTQRHYEVSAGTVYKWQKIYKAKGASGFDRGQGKLTDHEREILKLKQENEALKAIVAEKELALRIKNELLKKS